MAVGKTILHAGADTLKRATRELGGKSPVFVLDDTNFDHVGVSGAMSPPGQQIPLEVG
jgi:acyl-CoA reductase-like NAD-dependent aldehyde dehydrogenase